ncbi:hypothetical protein LIER_32546 [Lithospermum erythrorhizon]|uniref:DUF4283 domain-containing protein n=1 Tax=Lithospermum erythrorhizon TaxID=34254 RepID=A0AAV3RVY1_LITER
MDFVMQNNPLNVNGGLLVLDFWTPNLVFQTFRVNDIEIWMQIHGIPAEYFGEETVQNMAHAVGDVIGVEWNSNAALAREYIRVKVRLPLLAPVVPGAFLRTVEGQRVWVYFKNTVLANNNDHGDELMMDNDGPVVAPTDDLQPQNWLQAQDGNDENHSEADEDENPENEDENEDEESGTHTEHSTDDDDNDGSPPTGMRAIRVEEDEESDPEGEDLNYLLHSPISATTPAQEPDVEAHNEQADANLAATLQELLEDSDNELGDNDRLSFTEISQRLGEPDNRWIASLSLYIYIYTLTLEQILDIHLNFIMQTSFDEDENPPHEPATLDDLNTRKEPWNKEWLKQETATQAHVSKYPGISSEEAGIMYNRFA